MPQRKQTGSREPREGSSKPMGIIKNGKQTKIGQMGPKKGISKWSLCKRQQAPEVKNMVIGLRKSEGFNKNPWECRIGMSRGCPNE